MIIRRRHNPTETSFPSPSTLRGEQREFFDSAYQNAMSYYRDTKFARNSAWRSLLWATEGPRRNPRLPASVPSPRYLAGLANTLELVTLDDPPNLKVLRFNPGFQPELLWEPQRKFLLVLPNAKFPGTCEVPGRNPASQAYQTFTSQDPVCERRIQVPDYRLELVGPVDTVVYRSSKWTENRGNRLGTQEYIHQFGDGVMLQRSVEETRGVPNAFVISGGKLDMIAAGIIN